MERKRVLVWIESAGIHGLGLQPLLLEISNSKSVNQQSPFIRNP